MATVDELLAAFTERLRVPWRLGEAAAGRVWMMWYPKEHERRIRGRFGEFREAALKAEKGWHEIDLAPEFGAWVAAQPWFERAAKRPGTLPTVIGQFDAALVRRVRDALAGCGPNDILAVTGAAALFGLTRTENLIANVASIVPGRLLVTFPGTHKDGIYRLLDARPGHNYLAVPIPSENMV